HLGAGLDGLFVTTALGQRLHQHQLRAGRVLVPGRGDLEAHLWPVADAEHLTGDACPGPVHHLDPIAGPHPHGTGGMTGFGAAQGVLVPRAEVLQLARLGEELRQAHLLWNFSRSRENMPGLAGARRASGRSSPRMEAKFCSRLSCSSSSLVGTVTLICTCRSPRPPPRRCPTPRSRSVTTSPGWVPGRMSTCSTPSRVSSSRTVPSAAAVIGTSIVQCRSSPRRVNTG